MLADHNVSFTLFLSLLVIWISIRHLTLEHTRAWLIHPHDQYYPLISYHRCIGSSMYEGRWETRQTHTHYWITVRSGNVNLPPFRGKHFQSLHQDCVKRTSLMLSYTFRLKHLTHSSPTWVVLSFTSFWIFPIINKQRRLDRMGPYWGFLESKFYCSLSL